MNNTQKEIKEKTKALHIGNVINWISVKDKLPPENVFVLVKREGYLPYSAILENSVWDDRNERSGPLVITHWTELL